MESVRVPRALTIAGSDSGGGAGLQADLRTFYALGVYGLTAVSAVTVQDTRGVSAVHDLPDEIVAAQIAAVAGDIGADAVKTGMLWSARVVEAVAAELERHGLTSNLVVDPVLAAGSGDRLMGEDGVEALRTRLIPLALAVTPNVPEAEALTGVSIANERDLGAAARRLHALGPRWVIIKGGHLPFGEGAVDYLYDGTEFTEVPGERLPDVRPHGAGCTYSAALAAWLARGEGVPEAARGAKDFATAAIRHRLDLGAGRNPVNHWGNRWFAYGRTST